MKVWLDWDSGPFEIISNSPPPFNRAKVIEDEMSEADYAEYETVLKRYTEWQDRLYKMRKRRPHHGNDRSQSHSSQ